MRDSLYDGCPSVRDVKRPRASHCALTSAAQTGCLGIPFWDKLIIHFISGHEAEVLNSRGIGSRTCEACSPYDILKTKTKKPTLQPPVPLPRVFIMHPGNIFHPMAIPSRPSEDESHWSSSGQGCVASKTLKVNVTITFVTIQSSYPSAKPRWNVGLNKWSSIFHATSDPAVTNKIMTKTSAVASPN